MKPNQDYLRAGWPLAVLAAANLGMAGYLNSQILTDDVYGALFAGEGSGTQVDTLVDMTRRWEVAGYFLGPLALATRIAIMTLAVQLGLILIGLRLSFGHVFRAGTWAQFAVSLGTLARLLWLVSLPKAAITADQIARVPGSLATILCSECASRPNLGLLLERVTVFDLGWIALFTLALEKPGKAPAATVAVGVVGVWVCTTLARWGFGVYLTGLS